MPFALQVGEEVDTIEGLLLDLFAVDAGGGEEGGEKVERDEGFMVGFPSCKLGGP